VDELPEAEIDRAEGVNVAHSHDGITAADGTLLDHLVSVHAVPVEPALSHSTQGGIHDRLHRETKAIDDPG